MLSFEELKEKVLELKKKTNDYELIQTREAKRKKLEGILYSADLYDIPSLIQWDSSFYEYLPDFLQNNERIITSHVIRNYETTKEYINEYGRLPYLPQQIEDAYKKVFADDLIYTVVGLRVCEGDEVERSYDDPYVISERILYCTKGNEKFECILSEWETNCSSCGAAISNAGIDVRKVEEFGEMTHIPKLPLTFQMQRWPFSCDAFEYIDDDHDEYHHNEYIAVKMEMFNEINNEKQQVKKDSLNDEELEALRAKKEQLYNLIVEASALYERFSEYNDSLDIPSLVEGEME